MVARAARPSHVPHGPGAVRVLIYRLCNCRERVQSMVRGHFRTGSAAEVLENLCPGCDPAGDEIRGRGRLYRRENQVVNQLVGASRFRRIFLTSNCLADQRQGETLWEGLLSVRTSRSTESSRTRQGSRASAAAAGSV